MPPSCLLTGRSTASKNFAPKYARLWRVFHTDRLEVNMKLPPESGPQCICELHRAEMSMHVVPCGALNTVLPRSVLGINL